MSIPGLSNPFSTGGGGDQFEKSVGVLYLVALLAEDIPRGLNQGITKRVRFQQRYAGTTIDDIIVVSNNAAGQEFKLALQVKHDLTFTHSESNKLFPRVISDCWNTFTNGAEWDFNPDLDRLGIAFGVQPPAKLEHLQRALDWARSAASANDYFSKLRTPHFASNQMRNYIDEVFRPVLSDIVGSVITDEQVFRFLRCLVILHFDLEHDGARDTAYAWNRLLDQLDGRDETDARKLADRLFHLTVEYNKDSAGFDYQKLTDLLGTDFYLRERVSCSADLARLRRHTDLVLGRITTSIGGIVSLPRSQEVGNLCACIKQAGVRAVVIEGEPGTGKSALMRLVADCLRQESDVIVTEVDRLRGPSLESFLEMLQVEHPLERLLGAMSSGSIRCMFIDQLDRVQEDEERGRVLDDLVHTVRQFNDQVLAHGGHDSNCWRVVVACRTGGVSTSIRNTQLVEYERQEALRVFEVGGLNNYEFQAVVERFPRLGLLSAHERTDFLLKRPFFLNLLTKRETQLDRGDLPDRLTETWFLKFFWEDVINRGQPQHQREQILLHIAKHRLETGELFLPMVDLNSQEINRLVSDQIVITEERGVRLAHDLFEDWVGARLIASEEDRLALLYEQAARPASLLRSIELRALYHLEVDQDARAWSDLTSIEGKGDALPSWRDVAIGAIFKSELLGELLELAKSLLLGDSSMLLSHMLRIMRTVYTEPSAFIRQVFAGVPQSVQLERHFSYSRDPLISLWKPVLEFILHYQDSVPLVVLPELAQVCEMWLRTECAPLRADVAQLCYKYLNQPFGDPLDDLAYRDDETITIHSSLGLVSEQTRRSFALALLAAADCAPDCVEAFVREDLEQERKGLIRRLLLEDGNWISMGKHLPDLFTEVAELILCWKPKPREYFEKLLAEPGPKSLTLHIMSEEEQYREMCRYGRLSSSYGYDWDPITYDRGPFYFFLRLNPQHGLSLIHMIVNHATNLWRRCQELDEFRPRTPLPQRLELRTTAVELWGDERVYCWSRTAQRQPPVECALRALEKWLCEQVENGADPIELLNHVLVDSTSLSVAGVLVSVSLKYTEECREALLPILVHPAFWVADIYRVIQSEPIAGLGIINFHSEAQLKSIRDWELASHRKLQIDHVAQSLLVSGHDESRDALRKAMSSFPDNIPFFFSEEAQSTQIVRQRLKRCECIASWADPATWNIEVVGEQEDGLLLSVEPQIPLELQEKYEQDEERLKIQEQKWRICQWAETLRDSGEVGSAYTLEEAVELVDRLPSLEQKLRQYERPDLLVEGLAAIVSGLIVHKLDWLQANDLVHWARRQLLDLLARPSAVRQPEIGPTVYPIGLDRSAALAVPVLLKEKPQDARLRSAAYRLAEHPHYEVRSYLFSSLQPLWDVDVDFVWECVAVALSRAKLVRRKGRTKTQRYHKGFLVRLGLRKQRLPKLAGYPPRDIDYYGLIPILSVFPSYSDIAKLLESGRFLDFVADLLKLTFEAHRTTQHRIHMHDSYLSSILLYWDPPFGQALARWTSYLPRKIAFDHIIRPMLREWTVVSDLLARTMQSAMDICAADSAVNQRFVEAWREIAEVVLSSNRFEREILGLLLCTGSFASRENTSELPLDDLIDIFDAWVQAVAKRKAGYEILIRFLRNAGFGYMVSHGVSWLAEAWKRIPDHRAILQDSRLVSDFAYLLLASWHEFGEQLQSNPDLLRQFSDLADHLAGQGNQVAVELQRKLRGLTQ